MAKPLRQLTRQLILSTCIIIIIIWVHTNQSCLRLAVVRSADLYSQEPTTRQPLFYELRHSKLSSPNLLKLQHNNKQNICDIYNVFKEMLFVPKHDRTISCTKLIFFVSLAASYYHNANQKAGRACTPLPRQCCSLGGTTIFGFAAVSLMPH